MTGTNGKRHTIRVVIAEDHPAVRAGLHRLLTNDREIEVVGEAANGYEAIQLTEELNPDVLLLDIEMPDMNGVLVAKVLNALQTETRVLVVSAYANREFALALLDYGVNGYITKDEAGDCIAEAVRKVLHEPKPWISDRIQLVLSNQSLSN